MMTILPWALFILFVLIMLSLDLGIFHGKAREISAGEALVWTIFWVAVSLAFNMGIYFIYEHNWLGIGVSVGHDLTGRDAAIQFLTGYVIEKSLSLDNIFVIALIFTYFKVPLKYQHRLLFWGILGALLLRGMMIALGYALIIRFWWVTYIFGAMLLATAVKILIVRHDNLEPRKNPVVRMVRRFYPVTRSIEGGSFFGSVNGKRAVTPLFLALIIIESTDVLFALDSIPAIFAVTLDPFIVFTSNVFAILGMRSLYFALAAMMEKFRYMKMSLVFLLAFVGIKMVLSPHHHITTQVSLAVIVGILAVGVAASVLGGERDTAPLVSPLADEAERLYIVTSRTVYSLVVAVIGTTVLLIGVVMIFLPGPAFIVIPAGLAILGSEFLWARRLLRRIKRKVMKITNRKQKGAGP